MEDAPWAQTCSALSTRGCRWLQQVLGVQGKEGETHYITLCLVFGFFFWLKYTGVASAFVLTPSLFNSVCSREIFFPPKPCYIKWMLLHWTTKRNPLLSPEKTQSSLSAWTHFILNSEWHKLEAVSKHLAVQSEMIKPVGVSFPYGFFPHPMLKYCDFPFWRQTRRQIITQIKLL